MLFKVVFCKVPCFLVLRRPWCSRITSWRTSCLGVWNFFHIDAIIETLQMKVEIYSFQRFTSLSTHFSTPLKCRFWQSSISNPNAFSLSRSRVFYLIQKYLYGEKRYWNESEIHGFSVTRSSIKNWNAFRTKYSRIDQVNFVEDSL